MGKFYSRCWNPPLKGAGIATEFSMTYSNGLHLDTGQWLKRLDLTEYSLLFRNYNGVEEMLKLTEGDLKALGVKNSSHRARMMTSLVILGDKYDRAQTRLRCLSAHISVRNSLYCSQESLNKSRRLSLPANASRVIRPARNSMEPLTGTEAAPEDLKKVLEWELSLDNNDLRSHAWYHGIIPRQRAEELMSEEGEFLIRDCISRPGDYVLSCRWKTTALHFVINKVVFQPFTVYEKIQFQFEDDCFDTVPDLVTYYVGNKRPISAASGAIVSRPVNRSMPLSYYATRYGLECQMHYATLALEKVANSENAQKGKTDTTPRRQSQPSDGLTKVNDESPPGTASTMPRTSGTSEYPHRSASTNFTTHRTPQMSGKCTAVRSGSNPSSANATMDRKSPYARRCSVGSNEPGTGAADSESVKENPPPKPSRVPSKRYGTTGYTGIDSNGQKRSSGSENSGSHLYSELNYPEKTGSSKRNSLCDDDTATPTASDSDANSDQRDSTKSDKIVIPDCNAGSDFHLDNFTSLLLPTDNKPLDPPALARMRCMILEYGPRVIASHLTQADLDVLKISGSKDLGLGVVTGFELLSLPQGQQMRLDLLERTECLKFFVAITILTCGDEDVRAQVLNKWIQIAVETKTALGNLYGFTGIMQGLAMSQISRLHSTWLKLRQNFTDIAFAYETKLRPTLKNMQDCTNPQAPNTCIPHLLSIILILQRHSEVIAGKEDSPYIEDEINIIQPDNTSVFSKEKGKIMKLGLPWEFTAADFGLQLLLTHMEIARSINQQWQTYRRNSEIVLENAKYDDLMLDMFRTEFQLRFLWGCKGSHVCAKERYSKFHQVLNVMSERCEPT